MQKDSAPTDTELLDKIALAVITGMLANPGTHRTDHLPHSVYPLASRILESRKGFVGAENG